MDFSHTFQIPPLSDWLNLLLLFGGIGLFIVLSESLRKYLKWDQAATRKIVHISVGVLMLFSPLLLTTSMPLLSIALFFAAFNYIALKKNLLPGIHIDRHNLGTVYYPLSFFLLVLFFWVDFKVIILASIMVMAVGDAAAAIVGGKIRSPHTYILISDKKSLEGSFTMFGVSAATIFLTFQLYPSATAGSVSNTLVALWFALLTALVATVAEALGNKGNDNLTVPLFTAVMLYYLLTGNTADHLQLTLGVVLGAIVSILSVGARFLSPSGAAATFLLASVVFGFGGWPWTVPILAFFILSSLLSKIGKQVKSQYDLIFEKGSRRDHLQVLANGGIAGFFMILHVFWPTPELYIYYLSALAAANADTWATEIGVLIGQRPRLISNWRRVPSGTSGGITAGGLFGALCGAVILAISGIGFLNGDYAIHDSGIFFIIVGSGFMGSIVDSYLGALVQIQYRCPVCEKVTEKRQHCNGNDTLPVSGISWMNNDAVNFFATISGLIFTAAGLVWLFS